MRVPCTYFQVVFFLHTFALNKAKATLGMGYGLPEEKLLNVKGELKVGINIHLKTVWIVGWRETCARQGVQRDAVRGIKLLNGLLFYISTNQ